MRRELKDFFPFLFFFFLIFLVFRSWFNLNPLNAKDWLFFYPENLKELPLIPYPWNNQGWGGMGRVLLYHWSIFYFYWPAKFFALLGLTWPVIEKIIWFWPFLALSLFSSWYLGKTLFPKNVFWFFSPLVFLFNPYILMVVGGGQMGIAMAYALAPLVLACFLRTINLPFAIRNSIFTALAFALQIMFDPRISLITIAAVFLYAIFRLGLALKSYFKTFVFPLLLAGGIHSFWLLPAFLLRRTTLPLGYGESGWAEFLSFADFSNSLSLLHPNWPENIFGKTYFMRPEFLILPILAFSSLLFINQLKSSRVKELENSSINNPLIINKTILFFASLALISAFLAKGVKPPLGEVYQWLFQSVPGMSLFRDPTKFYLLVAISYSLLIPYSLGEIAKRYKKLFAIRYSLFAIFILFWLFLIRPAWSNQLGGTFKVRALPQEYLVLKDFLQDQKEFFRTFWLPKRQTFGFYNYHHPPVNANELPSQEDLATMGVKYVIIPSDSEENIFLKDRQYDHEQRLALEEELDKVSWLKKIEVVDKIAVYETPSHKDHFFILDGEALSLDWTMVNLAQYQVRISGATQPFRLVFSETYDELWQARIGEKIIPSIKYNNINSFTLEQTGDFKITIEFAAQKYVYWGLVVSAITLLACLWYLVLRIKH